MAQNFKETAHLKVDAKAYAESFDRIFGEKISRATNTEITIPVMETRSYVDVRVEELEEALRLAHTHIKLAEQALERVRYK